MSPTLTRWRRELFGLSDKEMFANQCAFCTKPKVFERFPNGGWLSRPSCECLKEFYIRRDRITDLWIKVMSLGLSLGLTLAVTLGVCLLIELFK